MFNIIAIIITTLLELHFGQLFSSKADFKVYFEVQKIGLPFFSCQFLLLGTVLMINRKIIVIIKHYICMKTIVVAECFKANTNS